MIFFVVLTLCLGFGFDSIATEKTTEKNTQNEPISFLVGTGVRHYKYSESSIATTHEGILFDFWGEWYWTSAIGNGKVYGNFLYGVITYDGNLCDLSKNCTPYNSTTIDMIARINSRLEFELNKSFYLFAGAGYRYLYDRGEGQGFYTRTGNWVYLPIGSYIKYGKFSFELEYDLIVYGNLRSNLSEALNNYSDLTHSQKGYGLVITAGYRINPTWSVFSAYELWDLEESEPVASGESLFVEPKNNSQSFEFKVGYSF